MGGTVQEIRKKFEKLSNISSDDSGLNHGIYKQKVYSKQYKSLTALNLNDEQNNSMVVESDYINNNIEIDQEIIIISSSTTGQRNEILNIQNTKIFNMESESNKNQIDIKNDDENYQNINCYNSDPITNKNIIVEKEEEEVDIFPVEIKLRREKNRAFKSKTQLEERKKSNDDSKYYSHPNRIAGKRNSSIETYQNLQVNRDSSTSILEHIVDELVKTEQSFVSKLRSGYENYKTIFEGHQYMPKGLIGKKYVLFRTIEEILDFHENEMLPMLQTNQYDLKTLCLSFSKFIEEHKFYPHLLYIMHKRRAETLCKQYKGFFDEKAKELNDSLGIMSLLIQPLHRVTKYPLLFQQIIKDCFKNYDMKPVLQLCCKTEKKMSDYVKLINESERVGNIVDVKENINLYEEGRLKKVDKFYIYDSNLQKRFKSRVFLFEKSLIYTEISTKLNSEILKFRGIYPCDKLSIYLRDPGFTLYWEKPNIQDCDLEAKTEDIKNSWITVITNIVMTSLEKQRIQSFNTNHITPYSHLFRYRFLNRTDSIDSLASTSSLSLSSSNRTSDRNSIISTGSFHNY